ncbi:MAG: hypothetical protein Kow00121_67550 [Elainellaceae cyanobacterium]
MNISQIVQEIAQLAHDRGCVLRTSQGDDVPLYWVENQLFIGKPFECLDELTRFINLLPVMGQE